MKKPHILDGKQIAKEIYKEIAEKVEKLIDAGKRAPHLAVIFVGDDGASKTYVESIQKKSQEVGITSSVYHYPSTITQEELFESMDFLNQDSEVDGYIIQLPLPKHISTEEVAQRVDPEKDIDCFNPINIGNLVLGKNNFSPATPMACMEIIKRSNIDTVGKKAVVIGRSNIVGKPLALLLAQNKDDANATVTLAHSKTQNLPEIARQADILLVAMGKPEMIGKEYVKEGAVVIDVGIHRVKDETTTKGYRICGDVNYNEVAPLASAITPVPGGVGSVTMSCLLLNTLRAYKIFEDRSYLTAETGCDCISDPHCDCPE